MTEPGTGSRIVGQIADVLTIIGAVVSMLTVALAAFGKTPFAPGVMVVVPIAIAFAVVGLVALGTAFARNRNPETVLRTNGLATTRTLARTGVILLVFAVASLLLLVIHPTAACTTR